MPSFLRLHNHLEKHSLDTSTDVASLLSMSSNDGSSAAVSILIRQLLQLVPTQDLRWPDASDLGDIASQQYIWRQCFDAQGKDAVIVLPARYRLRVLKILIRKIESAIVDPEEDVRSLSVSFIIRFHHRLFTAPSIHLRRPSLMAAVLHRKFRTTS